MNEETIRAAKAALADISGLSAFSELKGRPLMKALSGLLETVLQTADVCGAGRNTGKRTGQQPPDWDAPLKLCRSWAAFIETCVKETENRPLRETILRLVPNHDTFSGPTEGNPAGARLSRAAAEADIGRINRIASLDIVRLGFDIAGCLRECDLPHAAQSIEAEVKALWISEGGAAP